jgi:RimJ/RimL family protein N-acetyltransferase
MQHSLTREGFGVRLRPVRMEDASFIVWLRHLEHAKGKLGDSEPDDAGQKAWLTDYFKREGDYYFIAETLTGIPVGTYGIYDVRGTTAEPGRWIVRPEVPAAIPSVILALDLAFEQLKITLLRGSTVSTNRNVLSLNRKLGFQQVRVETAARVIGGQPVDLVHYVLTAADWAKAREPMLPLARLAEPEIRDWEKTQIKRGTADTKGGAK